MSMNEMLAELYGTNQDTSAQEAELNKLAQVGVIDSMLQKEAGAGIEDLSSEEIVKVANYLFGEGNELSVEIVKAAMDNAKKGEMPEAFKGKGEDKGEEEDKDKEAAAAEAPAEDPEFQKLASQMDAAGRIMAHSMWQELSYIKQASEQEATPTEAPETAESEKTASGVVDVLASARLEEGEKEKAASEERRSTLDSLVEQRMSKLAEARGIKL